MCGWIQLVLFCVSDLRSASTSPCRRSRLGLRCFACIWATPHTAWASPTCGSSPTKQTATLALTSASLYGMHSCSQLGRSSLLRTLRRWAQRNQWGRIFKSLTVESLFYMYCCACCLFLTLPGSRPISQQQPADGRWPLDPLFPWRPGSHRDDLDGCAQW